MARISKTNKIMGPDGQEYPVSILDKQLVRSDTIVKKGISMAEKLSEIVAAYNQQITKLISEHLSDTAEGYGEKWQGNAVLKSFDGSMQIEVDIKQIKSYDERLAVAGEKIRSWLDSKLASIADPKQRKVFEQLSQIAKTALRIDHHGNVDQAKLIQLRKFDFSSEPEWVEAMELIAAAERVTGTKRYIRFKKADAKGKLVGIPVDFSTF